MKSKKHIKRRKPNRSRGGDFGIYLMLIFFGLFMAFPLVYAINSAFKPLNEIFVYPPRLFVQNPTFDNFQDLFVIMSKSWVPFSRYLFNTVFITILGTAGHIIIAAMGAYVLAKYRFPGSKTFFGIVVTALMFNGYVTAIPNYLVMSKIGLVDTPWAVIIPAFASPMGLFLMKQYMEGIPDALLEAAKIDGAKEWSIFSTIVMPMVRPAWLTLMILSIQALWNVRASNFIYSEDLKTLPYALQQIVSGGIARAGVGAAVTLVMMIVPITTFIVVESNVIETMASSGIKD
ncbi:carbohydrate ABC transporter permease [Anaerocolumna sp. AGMB13025]|uniref:carbohydrate ABC transporter permease n=1 Tax=Anaerocolumna sp. AGMB13025 TaxID=3039116 RepID=UPI00241CF838|nr:carbohydrate ABC transporter permease [Anaerocolumna sp. AGMB13025]WFR60068.1 carbohydrate ABC transporter permease [Anaerocolumna sp. AGMB13025]